MGKNARRFPRASNELVLNKILERITISPLYTSHHQGKFLRLRDKLIVSALFYTGMNPMELIPLTWSQVDWERKEIRLNDEAPPLFIGEDVIRALGEYRHACTEQNICSEYIFPSIWTNTFIDCDSIAKRVRSLFEEAGIPITTFYKLYRWDKKVALYIDNASLFNISKILNLIRLPDVQSRPAIRDNNHVMKLAEEVATSYG